MVENLVTKLSAAMKDIKAVEKDGNNDFQHYTFQSESAIKNAVKQALQNHGLMIIPSYKVTEQYDRKSSKGSLNHFVDVLGTFEITDGSQSIKGEMPGSGQDTGEKATAKACTSAQKYFYKQLFNISDKDEDPDGESSTPNGNYRGKPTNTRLQDNKASQTAIKKAVDEITALAKARGSNPDKSIGIFMNNIGLKGKDINEITESEYLDLTSEIARYKPTQKEVAK